MIDHTYCYTPAVQYIREAIADGLLGDLLYIDSVRINLGLVQPDVDVFWDLAPHDLSILDFILPGGLAPTSVSATGSDPLGAGKACVGYLSMPLASGGIAHVNVNWLSPTKIRQMVIGGSRRTLVWDDLNPQQRVAVFDRGVDLATQGRMPSSARQPPFRTGSATSPFLRCRRGKHCRRWWPSSLRPSARTGLRGPTGGRPAGAVGARCGVEQSCATRGAG